MRIRPQARHGAGSASCAARRRSDRASRISHAERRCSQRKALRGRPGARALPRSVRNGTSRPDASRSLVLRSLRSFVSSPVARNSRCAIARFDSSDAARDPRTPTSIRPPCTGTTSGAKEIIARLGRVAAALGLAQRRAAQFDDGTWIDAVLGRGALERHALAHARDDVRDVLDRQLRATRQLVELRERLGKRRGR